MSDPDVGSLLGKLVEVSMDMDHSREVFYGKGKIIHFFSNPPAIQSVVIEFDQVNKGFFRKNKNRYLILEYEQQNKYSLQDTFNSGYSRARVLRLKNPKTLVRETYSSRETKWLGYAAIYQKGGLGTVPY